LALAFRPSLQAGSLFAMTALRKITVEVPEATLRAAMHGTGEGVSETVRRALEVLAHTDASARLHAARGTMHFDVDWRTLRGKDDEA
jgi:hypothetical protein